MRATGSPVGALLARQHDDARRLLPADVYDYYSSGAGDEVATAEAVQAWQGFRLRPRVLRDVTDVDLATKVLGASLATPLGVAPMAFHRLAHVEGEAATARGAGGAGALTVVSTRASLPLEDVAGAATGPWWFQVYVMRDRGLTQALVERAAQAGAGALVLTGDTPYVGAKAKVNGVRFALPPDEFLINLERHLTPGTDAVTAASQDPSITTDVIGWLAEVSGLPVVVKGVLRGDDAERCLAAGASGVLVSNHGGRQLSRAVPTAAALAEVVDAVAGRAPVLVDGGIRTGLDVLVALGLGADVALLGRPVLWALASGGASGVTELLQTVSGDLAHALALLGSTTPAGVGRGDVRQAGGALDLPETTDAASSRVGCC